MQIKKIHPLFLLVLICISFSGCTPAPEKIISNDSIFMETVNNRRVKPIREFNDTVTLILKDTFYFPSIHSIAFGVKIEEERYSYNLLLLRDSTQLNNYCFLPCSFPHIANSCFPNMLYTHNVGYHDLNNYLTNLKNVQAVPFSTIDSLFKIMHGYAHEIGVRFNDEEGIPRIRILQDIDRYKTYMDSSRTFNTELLKVKLKDKNFRLYYYGGGLESIELISNEGYGMAVCDSTSNYSKPPFKGKKRYMVFHIEW